MKRRTFITLNRAVASTVLALASINGRSVCADDMGTISSRVQSQLLSAVPSDATIQGYMSSEATDPLNPSTFGSWSDINYASTAQTNWSPGTHVARMASMAEAWANPHSSLYHNAALAADLRDAMDYWFTFPANASSNQGNPTPYSTNWFDNDISGPQSLGSAMVMAQSDPNNPVFTSSELSLAQNYLANAKRTIPSFTGQNVVDLSIVGVYNSIVSGSSADMSNAFNSMNGTVFVSNFGTDGIQADHTYHIHNIQLYMGGYGTSYINDMLNWATVSTGTSYALTTDQLHTVIDYLLDGTQWFIRGKTLDLAANGRQVTFPSYVGAGTGYVGTIKDALALGNYRTAELQAFLARQQNTINSGAASSTQNTLTGNRYFYDSDVMVQQRPAYYASVKATSTRTSDPESGNSQGLKNLYLGDGVNQIMVTGNEYLGIQPSWNWYRLPGTTVEQDGRSLKPATDWGAVHGNSTYAGGVSDGKYGAEGFNYGRLDVAAKKSWFFFDNEQVALGTAINSSNGSFEVDTTLNQCLLTSSVSYETAGAASQTISSGTVTPANLKWVWQGGVGYVFLSPVSNATVSAIPQSGAWASLNTAASGATVTQNVFTLYINHGTAVSNGSYGYIAVPGITADQMDGYLASNPIQVLSNTSTVQAVHQATLNMTQAAFYSTGSLTLATGQTVATSAPSAIILQNQPSTLKLSASSPQAGSGALAVTLTGVNLSGGSTWFDAMGTATAGFNLPAGSLAGSSVGVTLSNDQSPTPTVTLASNDGVTSSSYTVSVPVMLPASTTFQEDKLTTLSFAGTVSGNAGITQSGPGVLVLSGSNTFSGGLTINGGSVRNLSATGEGAGAATINPGGDMVVGAMINSPITLAGGNLNFSGTPTLSGTITAAASTTSVIQSSDPLTPSTSVNASFTGALQGSGTIVLLNATGVTSPDGGQAFRINSANSSSFSGTIVVSNNAKGELFGQTSGNTTPAGTGNIILTAGDAALGNTLNTLTSTGGYSELNLRNNASGNQIYSNNVQITGTGLTVINPLGTAPAGASVTMGNLQMGAGQTLGVYLASSFSAHPVAFQSVTLTGGVATFAPKPNGFGATNSTGSDLYLGSIAESAPNSGITMSGLRTLILNGDNTYTGPTTVNSGTLVFAPNPLTGQSTSSIAGISGAAPVIVNSGAKLTSDSIQLPSLTINGSVKIRNSATGSATSKLNVLTISGSGALDLANNDLIVEDAATHADSFANLRTQVLNGAAHQSGIFSSTLPTWQPIVVVDNSQVGLTVFGGLAVDANSILVGPAIPGDVNLDDIVNTADFSVLAAHFNQTGQTWAAGDFNGDGVVNALDFNALASNFGQQPTSAVALTTLVPEAISPILLACSVATLIPRRIRITGR
jgi:autotransporter-associated beta strand protein